MHARQTIHTSPHHACRVLQSHANLFALLGMIREVDGGGCGTLCGPHLSLQKCGCPRSGLSPRQKWAMDRQKGAGLGQIAPGLASIRGFHLDGHSFSIWSDSLSLPRPGLSPLYSKPANNMLLTILGGQTLDKLVPTTADSPTAGSALHCGGGCFGYIILSNKFIILSLKINYSCQQGAV